MEGQLMTSISNTPVAGSTREEGRKGACSASPNQECTLRECTHQLGWIKFHRCLREAHAVGIFNLKVRSNVHGGGGHVCGGVVLLRGGLAVGDGWGVDRSVGRGETDGAVCDGKPDAVGPGVVNSFLISCSTVKHRSAVVDSKDDQNEIETQWTKENDVEQWVQI